MTSDCLLACRSFLIPSKACPVFDVTHLSLRGGGCTSTLPHSSHSLTQTISITPLQPCPFMPVGDSHHPSSLLLTPLIHVGEPLGRVKMELFAHVTPKTAENFRQYCTGENKNPQGRPQGYKGSKFHRVVCQQLPVGPSQLGDC